MISKENDFMNTTKSAEGRKINFYKLSVKQIERKKESKKERKKRKKERNTIRSSDLLA
jgi:hypothetical protein